MKTASGCKINCWLRDVEIPTIYCHCLKILCILFKAHSQTSSVSIKENHLTVSAQSVQWLRTIRDGWPGNQGPIFFTAEALLRTDSGPRMSVVQSAEVKRPGGEDGHLPPLIKNTWSYVSTSTRFVGCCLIKQTVNFVAQKNTIMLTWRIGLPRSFRILVNDPHWRT